MRKKLNELIDRHELKGVTFNDCLNACPYSLEELRSSSRIRELVDWRHVCILFSYKETINLSNTGLELNRTHSSVIHSIKEIDKGLYEINQNIEAVKWYNKNRKNLCYMRSTKVIKPEAV